MSAAQRFKCHQIFIRAREPAFGSVYRMYEYNNSVMFKIVYVLLACTVVSAGVPNPDEKRILDRDLSDVEHFQNQHHNPQYDHEAFLGEDQAKTFDQLPPEESRRRLGIIVAKIDKDNDGFITYEELKDWIRYTQHRYITNVVEQQWRQHNPENKENISWESYRKSAYGFMDEMSDTETDDAESFSYQNMLKRDRRRWHHADADENDVLNITEFEAFLHPEENPLMRAIIVMETMEDIDTNKDGKISLSEYIGDMYRPDGEDDIEPDWVKNEREQFTQYRDTNKDGFMDLDEVKTWIAPPDFDHAEAESRHLIFEADTDADEKLTKDEILAKYDLFVGSQATDFGEALARHDEF